MKAETQRQIEHMVAVAFAVLLRWAPLWVAITLATLAVFYGALVSPHLFKRTLRKKESDLGFSPSKIMYGLVVLAMLLVFRENLMHVVAGAWALMAIGDGMSNIVGSRYGRAKIPWNRDKSWEGFGAFVVFGGIAAGLLVWWVAGREGGPQFGLWQSMCFALVAAVAAGLIETVHIRFVDDNISVPIVAAFTLYVLTGAATLDPVISRGIALALNFALGYLAWRGKAVGTSGLVLGLIIGAVTALCLGLPGFALLALMFILGSGATRWGYSLKKSRGIAQESDGSRDWTHAAANCAAAAACALLAASGASPGAGVWVLGFAAALATAAMDTVSSELGSIYGRVTVLLPRFRRVEAGTDGGVSIEGTLLGLAAALLVTGAGWWMGLFPGWCWWIIPVAAIFGTTVESLLGSIGVGKIRGGNTVLNIINTVAGAALAMLLGVMLDG